jgi:hypothetical protein
LILGRIPAESPVKSCLSTLTGVFCNKLKYCFDPQVGKPGMLVGCGFERQSALGNYWDLFLQLGNKINDNGVLQHFPGII